jgi:predicted MFS family arabinose efflux permease
VIGVLQRYADLLRVPGVAHTIWVSLPGRLPIGMASLAMLLYVQNHSGSFAHAGTVAACYVLGLGVFAPFLGRLMDRFGPRPVLTASVVIYPLALLTLMVLVANAARMPWVVICALLAGALLPPITICMRALFPRLLTDAGQLQAAYAMDSALIELVFILGPGLVALFVAIGYPGGAVVLSAACGGLGALLFLRAPPIHSWGPATVARQRSLMGPLHNPRLRKLLIVTLLYASAFGLFEVAVTAFAVKRGMPGAAGVILALASAGSALGVLVYGSRSWALPLPRQLLCALMLMAGGILLLVPVANVYWFGALCVITCVPMAPVIATQSILVSRLAPRRLLAESFTWATTCLLAGISGGIAAGGMLVEAWPPSVVLLAAAAMATAAALLTWAALPVVAGEMDA